MSIEQEINALPKALETESLHTKFLQPFNTEEVVNGFQNPVIPIKDFWDPATESDTPWRKLYGKDFPGFLEYGVYSKMDTDTKTVQMLNFSLGPTYQDSKKFPTAEFLFTKELESGFVAEEGKSYWNLMHRFIASQNMGISGTDFLKKAEEYLSILKEKELLEATTISASASQPSVLLWFKKNGFSFNKGNINEIENYFTVEDGEIKPKPPYQFVGVKDMYDNTFSDPYIINGDFFANESFAEDRAKYVKFKENSQEPYIEMVPHENGEEGFIEKLQRLGYIPRLFIEKNIN